MSAAGLSKLSRSCSSACSFIRCLGQRHVAAIAHPTPPVPPANSFSLSASDAASGARVQVVLTAWQSASSACSDLRTRAN
eukprot:1228453-Pyramimonas_sp.AAC.1